MLDIGMRLQLLVGPTVPVPASYDVTDALRSVEVRNGGGDHDGFQLELTLGKSASLDYSLLQGGVLDPPNRMILIALVNATPETLIDGIITDHQIVPGERPGESTLRISGLDVSVMMELEEKTATYPNQPDALIVTRIVATYAQYGLVPAVTPMMDVPLELRRVTSQQCSDFDFIQALAERNGFVFYVEPTAVPGVNKAYWGPETRAGLPQPPLTWGMTGQTNLTQPPHIHFDALAPVRPDVSILESKTGSILSLPVPNTTLPLALRPAKPMRKKIARDTARLDPAQAVARGSATATEGGDPIVVTGEVDVIRYGRVLRARRLVFLRGVGLTYSGLYWVKQVTHDIRRGSAYMQRFTLVREGRVAQSPLVYSI